MEIHVKNSKKAIRDRLTSLPGVVDMVSESLSSGRRQKPIFSHPV